MKIRYLPIPVVILLILTLGSGCVNVPNFTFSSAPLPIAAEFPNDNLDSADLAYPPEVAEMIRNIVPAVVAIDAESCSLDASGGPVTEQVSGSGWILNRDGFIVTSNHVVEGAKRVIVTLGDGQSYPAKNIQSDPVADLAVIDIGTSTLISVAMGDSSKIAVGEGVIAIGNAMGKEIRATLGTISSTNSTFIIENRKTYNNMLETTAPIAFGVSGGPLFNLNGEVIGIITGVNMTRYGAEVAGYAISSNVALPLIQKLIGNDNLYK